MVKGESIQTSVQQNDWKETKVRWGIERLLMVLFRQLAVVVVIFFLSANVVFGTEGTTCKKSGIELQILGSGGPVGWDERASSGYLVWGNGRPHVMIDAGGGTFLRLHQAGARVKDIKVLGLTHFHPDHVSELPALLWSGTLSRMKNPLVVSGPSGSEAIPGLTAFLGALFNTKAGAFPWAKLSGREPKLQAVETDFESNSPVEIYKDGDLRVTAVGVPHAHLPTLGYRVDIGGVSVGFGADQAGTGADYTEFSRAFVRLVQGVDVLVMHFAVSEEVKGGPIRFHAKPSVVGKIAQAAGVRTLVLSHLFKVDGNPNFSLANLESNLAHVKNHYSGTVVVAEDLKCIEVKKIAKKQ